MHRFQGNFFFGGKPGKGIEKTPFYLHKNGMRFLNGAQIYKNNFFSNALFINVTEDCIFFRLNA